MNEFSVASLLAIARKCLVYLIAAVIICSVAAYSYCEFIAIPTYQSRVSFIASNGGVGSAIDDSGKIISSDVAASLAMVNTYVDILKTSGAYKQLETVLGGKYDYRQLRGMIAVEMRNEDSLFIDVRVTSTDPEDSVTIANAFLSIGESYVSNAMNEPDKKLILKAEDSASVTQNYPNTTRSMFMAAAFGFIAVYAIALIVNMLVNMLDKTIKGETDFAENYDIPILGNIPNFKSAAKGEKRYEKYEN